MCLVLSPLFADYAIKNPETPERGEDEYNEGLKPQARSSKGHNSKAASAKSVGKRKSGSKSRQVSDSGSSCREDESYYEYKQRMLRKARADRESAAEKSDSSNSSSDSSGEGSARDGRKHHDDRTFSTSARKESGKPRSARSQASSKGDSVASHPRGSPKKRSSTYSGPGQAEPVRRATDVEDERRGAATTTTAAADAACGTAGRGERGERGARAHRGPDAGDTADEVSDIESEIAASPRKSGRAGNECETAQGGVPASGGMSGLRDGSMCGYTRDKDVIHNGRASLEQSKDSSKVAESFRSKKSREGRSKSIQLENEGNHGSKLDLNSDRLDGFTEKSKKNQKKPRTKKEISTKIMKTPVANTTSPKRETSVERREEIEINDPTALSARDGLEDSFVKNGDVTISGGNSAGYHRNSPAKTSPVVTPTWQQVLDAAEGEETGGLQLNLDPKEQTSQRGERGCTLTDREEVKDAESAESDRRGTRLPHDPAEWAIYQGGRPVKTSAMLDETKYSGDREVEEEEQRAGLRDGESKKAAAVGSSSKLRSAKVRSNISCKQVNSLLDKPEFSSDDIDQTVGFESSELCREDEAKSQDIALNYECKPMFCSKITSIPMPKTGENKYLNKQSGAQRRRKSESLKANLRDSSKRNGQFYGDLSYPESVIPGFAGDSLSDNDEDETYSRLGPLEDRANLSDQERDLAGPKNYVLTSSSPKVKIAVSSATSMTENTEVEQETSPQASIAGQGGGGVKRHDAILASEGDTDPDALTYRVLIGEEDIALRKSAEIEEIERMKREEEKVVQARNQLDDVRGKTRSGDKQKTKTAQQSGLSKSEREVHPSIREAGSRQYRRDPESYYSPKYPRLDSERSELEVTAGGESGRPVRHPQLPACPATNSSSLAFRHSFVEEPAPRIFRPGIDDKNRIQSHVTPRSVSDAQNAASEADTSGALNVGYEDQTNQDGDRMNNSGSVQCDHTKDVQSKSEPGTVESVDEFSGGVVKEKAKTPSSSGSSSDTSQTSSSSESTSESSEQAQAEIVGTWYVDKEGSRYARHHKAFKEAPLIGQAEFAETGATVSVLTPCDRSGLPIHSPAAAGGGGPQVGKDIIDGDDVDAIHSHEVGDMNGQLNVREIPNLSVNTPGLEYDHADREFEKLQHEKKRLQAGKTEKCVAEEKTDVNEPNERRILIPCKNADGEYAPSENTAETNSEGFPTRVEDREEDTNIHENLNLENSAKLQNSDISDLTFKAQKEITSSRDNCEAKVEENARKSESEATQGKATTSETPRSMTGADLLDMYLGKRRDSSPRTDTAKQVEIVLPAVENEEETEKREDQDQETDEARKPTDSDSKYDGGDDERLNVSTIAEGAVKSQNASEMCDMEGSNTKDYKTPVTEENKPRSSPRHRESVTATNLMDLWLGGGRARQTREKMDHVMHHVSDGDSSHEDLPGQDIDSNLNVLKNLLVENINSGNDVANADRKQDPDGVGKDDVDGGRNQEVYLQEDSQTRRDSHADDDDSGSSSCQQDDAVKMSTKAKKMKKVKINREKGSSIVEETPQISADNIVKKAPKNITGTENTRETCQDVDNEGVAVRKSSIPDVFIITADGNKIPSILNASGEDEELSGPEGSGESERETIVEAENKTGVDSPGESEREIIVEAENKTGQDSPSFASDVSGMDALIECLEMELNGTQDGTQPIVVSGGSVENTGEVIGSSGVGQDQDTSTVLSTEREVDALFLKHDLSEKTGGQQLIKETSDVEVLDEIDLLLLEEKQTHVDISAPKDQKDLENTQNCAPTPDPAEGTALDDKAQTTLPKQTELAETVSDSLGSLEDAETISGEDEDDAARRYVERILQSVTVPGSSDVSNDSPHGPRQIESTSTDSCSNTNSQDENVHVVSVDQDRDLAGLEAVPMEDAPSQLEFDGSDNSVTPRTSTLHVAGSENSERRKQRKLTVSFAVDEEVDVDGERSETETDDVPWESVDDGAKEDAYERLERQLERSLQIS